MDLNEIDYELGLFLESAPGIVPEESCQIQSGSVAGLSPKREVKGARRVRNACLQCRDRKIRCSRTYPCKGCVSRGDGASCDWQGGFPTGNIPIHQKQVADQRRQIEKLKDRLTCAKACLASAVQSNPTLKLEPALILPMPSREESISWFSTGSSNQPPGSALSNISGFSTNTVDSSQGGSHEDTVYSPLSPAFHTSIWKEHNPSLLFDIRPKTAGYRPLSLLREEDGLAVGGSRPYTASPGKTSLHSSWSVDFLDSIALDRRIPRAYGAYPENSTLEHNSTYQSTSHVPEGMSAFHQVPSLTSFAPSGSSWRSDGPKNARVVQCHERQRGNPSEVESGSPITPSRHSQDFSLPYIASLRGEEISSSGARNMCQLYLPQRQYFGGQDVEPTTGPIVFNFRDLPWTGALSPNLEQRIQADVASGLMDMGEQYNFLPSASTTSISQLPTYNLSLAPNWPPFPP